MSAEARKILDELPGIKQREIKACALCDKGVAYGSNFMFWRLRFDRAAVNPRGVEQQHGLELMLGSPRLATIMGADPDIAKVLDGPHDVWICEPCVLDKMLGLFLIAEKLSRKERAAS